MARIVIAGAGFAGIEAARTIARGIALRGLNGKYEIILIDKNAFHTFTPALIPAATTPLSVSDEVIQNAVTIPLSSIQFAIPVTIVTDEITRFDIAWNSVVGIKKHYEYDYLIIATGKESTFFDMQGARTHALPLKTVSHALSIRKKIAEQIQAHDANEMRVVVMGGGPVGVEFAGLLKNRARRFIRAQGGRCEINVTLLEANETILATLIKRLRERITKYLSRCGVTVITNARASYISNLSVEFQNRERLPFDVLVWSAGTIAPPMVATLPFEHGRGNTIKNTETGHIKIEGSAQVGRPTYAAGDVSFFGDSVAWIAHNAIDSGALAAEHILEHIDFAERLPHECTKKILSVNNNGVFMVSDTTAFTTFSMIPPFFGVTVRRYIDLFYLIRILPFSNAFKKWREMRVVYKG